MAKLSKRGGEVLDTTPIAVPVRRTKPHSVIDHGMMLVHEMQRAAAEAEEESLDDANDFDMYDEDDIKSRHEEFIGSPEYELMKQDIRNFDKKKKLQQEEIKQKSKKKKKEEAEEEDDEGSSPQGTDDPPSSR